MNHTRKAIELLIVCPNHGDIHDLLFHVGIVIGALALDIWTARRM